MTERDAVPVGSFGFTQDDANGILVAAAAVRTYPDPLVIEDFVHCTADFVVALRHAYMRGMNDALGIAHDSDVLPLAERMLVMHGHDHEQ